MTSDASDEPSSGELTLADKIDRLFVTMHPVDRGEWTYQEVSDGVKAHGVTLSPSYIWQLRKGTRTNPTVRQIDGLARFFHVPVTYFFGSDEQVEAVDAQMSVVRAMRDRGVRDVALRAATLTPAGLRAVAGIIEQLAAVDGMTAGRRPRRTAKVSPATSRDG